MVCCNSVSGVIFGNFYACFIIELKILFNLLNESFDDSFSKNGQKCLFFNKAVIILITYGCNPLF